MTQHGDEVGHAWIAALLSDAGWMREHMSPNRLAIIPNATHYDILMSPGLVPTVRPFLDGNTGGPPAASATP